MSEVQLKKIGFIGAGQMATALACGIAASNEAYEILVADPSADAIKNFQSKVGESIPIKVLDSNQSVAESSDLVVLAVKPQLIHVALDSISIPESTLVVSVVAGVRTFELERLTGTTRVIRVMPNTPCLIGKGACGLAAGSDISASDVAFATQVLEPTGMVTCVTEDQLDAVTGLSGSGPAFVFTFVESLIDGGVLTGLPRNVARDLAIQTVLGAVEMMRSSGDHPGVLRDRVTSPGGTTIAGMKALEETGFRDSVMSAVVSATERSGELGG